MSNREITFVDRLMHRLFSVLFGITVILTVTMTLLRILFDAIHAHPLGFLLILAVASVAAYFVREHRLRRPRRETTTRGAERTPIVPQGEAHVPDPESVLHSPHHEGETEETSFDPEGDHSCSNS